MKVVLLDRDGTIIRDPQDERVDKEEKIELFPDSIKALKLLAENNFSAILITNQAGIAKGYYTEEDYYKLEKFIINDLNKKGIVIEKTYFCPHHPKGIGKYRKNCECRKPNKQNFLKAINEFNIDVKNSYMIGDRITDLIPAKELGFNTVLVKTGYGLKNIKEIEEKNLKSLIMENIPEFVDYIKNKK